MDIQSALVLSILQQWRSYEWTVQGFGFIRTKIANVGRIHVWDSRLAVDLVSTMHTHPWPLHSTIISGELINQRFALAGPASVAALSYLRAPLQTGEGGGLVGESEDVRLVPHTPEVYGPGQSYKQDADEIHRTIAQDGTVTLIERPQGPPDEKAFTFWPRGTFWVSAEPQPAVDWRIEPIISHALARWDAA